MTPSQAREIVIEGWGVSSHSPYRKQWQYEKAKGFLEGWNAAVKKSAEICSDFDKAQGGVWEAQEIKDEILNLSGEEEK